MQESMWEEWMFYVRCDKTAQARIIYVFWVVLVAVVCTVFISYLFVAALAFSQYNHHP